MILVGEMSCENGEGVEETILAMMDAYFGQFPVCHICKGPVVPSKDDMDENKL